MEISFENLSVVYFPSLRKTLDMRLRCYLYLCVCVCVCARALVRKCIFHSLTNRTSLLQRLHEVSANESHFRVTKFKFPY